jgi:hypothetical protein
MACSLTTGRAALTGCGATKAGLNELHTWLVNRSAFTPAAISATTGISADFTVTSVLLPFVFDARGFQFDETMTTDANTGAQTHKPVITGRLIGLSGANRADVEKLKGTNLVAIIETKAGKYMVVGYTAGLTLDTNEAGSTSDKLGELITLSTTENNPEASKYFEYLDTDAATSLAALIAAEV